MSPPESHLDRRHTARTPTRSCRSREEELAGSEGRNRGRAGLGGCGADQGSGRRGGGGAPGRRGDRTGSARREPVPRRPLVLEVSPGSASGPNIRFASMSPFRFQLSTKRTNEAQEQVGPVPFQSITETKHTLNRNVRRRRRDR